MSSIISSCTILGVFHFQEFPLEISDRVPFRHLSHSLVINSEDDGEIVLFPAAATFTRRDLNRNQGYFEVLVPTYSIDEFEVTLYRMTRRTEEALCKEVQITGRVTQQQSFGRSPIPLDKQEVIRSVSDRFNVTLSSLNRIIHWVSGACVDLRKQYIKWPNSKLQYMLIF